LNAGSKPAPFAEKKSAKSAAPAKSIRGAIKGRREGGRLSHPPEAATTKNFERKVKTRTLQKTPFGLAQDKKSAARAKDKPSLR
jgi:hypothetical protein